MASLSPPEREDNPAFEVTVEEDGEVVHTALFTTLEEAEAFAEEWTDRVPHAHCEIEDLAHTHQAQELIGAETPLEETYRPDPSQ